MMKLLTLILWTTGELSSVVQSENTLTLVHARVQKNNMIVGYQNLKITWVRKEILEKAMKTRLEIENKIKEEDEGKNDTIEIENYKKNYFHPFLKHMLFRVTMLTHEIITAENFLHILSTDFNMELTHTFGVLPYIKADESASLTPIPYKMIKLDFKVLKLVEKMRSVKTQSKDTYRLELIILGETLKKVLNTNSNQLNIFCNDLTQRITLERSLAQYVKENETMEVLKSQLAEVKQNFLDRVSTLFPELEADPQILTRRKRNLWGSLWGAILSLPTNEEVDKVKHNTEILINNEREITQKFNQFDATSKLIAKHLQINEENFDRIRKKENQIADFLRQEEITQKNLKKKFKESMAITTMAIDEINTIMMFNSDLNDLSMMAKELTQTVHSVMGIPNIHHIPVTRLNPSVFRNPRFLDEARPTIEANMTHYSTTLRIPYSEESTCVEFSKIPILTGTDLYELDIPKFIVIYRGKFKETQSCRDLENAEFTEPDNCIKALLNYTQENITTVCPVIEVKRKLDQYALILPNRIIVLSRMPDILYKNCPSYTKEIKLREGYTEITTQQSCEYSSQLLYIPPQFSGNETDVEVHFDNQHINKVTLNFPQIDNTMLPNISDLILEKGEIKRLRDLLQNNPGEIHLMYFDLNDTVHANVFALNIVLATLGMLWILIKIYKNWGTLISCARKCSQRNQRYQIPERNAWTIRKGNLGEYLLINQDEKLVYHPIKKEVFSTDTQTKVDHPEIPPWAILEDYQNKLNSLKQNIVLTHDGGYIIKLDEENELKYDVMGGNWTRGGLKIIGFPEP